MCLGLFVRQERWCLSLRGWLLLLGVAIVGALAGVRGVYPFLALTTRTETDLLAVEGWAHDGAMRTARDEFHSGSYRLALATGGPLTGNNGFLLAHRTAASVGAERLRHAGVPAERVQSVPAGPTSRDRTYHSALALRDWLHARQISVRSLNVVTDAVHARRTRLLFQLAFGPDVAVGVIAAPNPDYDTPRWWRTSAGVRAVLGEAISYVYAKCFFFPPPPPALALPS